MAASEERPAAKNHHPRCICEDPHEPGLTTCPCIADIYGGGECEHAAKRRLEKLLTEKSSAATRSPSDCVMSERRSSDTASTCRYWLAERDGMAVTLLDGCHGDPEGDQRCGYAMDACRCMKRKGHDGLHACAHGGWNDVGAKYPPKAGGDPTGDPNFDPKGDDELSV